MSLLAVGQAFYELGLAMRFVAGEAKAAAREIAAVKATETSNGSAMPSASESASTMGASSGGGMSANSLATALKMQTGRL